MTAEPDRPDPKSPVDLAREGEFELGALRVSPSTREVLRCGEREILEPRVMQVLVALYRANGRVVSRDELISLCWDGRIVGEDAINRAIGRLRRLSEADQEASFVIETIPRVGYRLLAGPSVAAGTGSANASFADEARDEATRLPGAFQKSGHPWMQRYWRLVAGLVLLAVVASAMAAWLLRSERRWTVESSRPFISTLALEDYPAFSPNGTMLAYTSAHDGGQRQIYVRNPAGGGGIRITNDSYDDISPTWSSDGARIAYVAIKPEERCRIMVATVPDGEAREAGRCLAAESSSLAWQPGTSFVYSNERAGLKGDIIYRLDLDTGVRQAIVRKSALRDIISSPRCSPDGKWLAYIVWSQGIVVHNLDSGRETMLGNVSERGVWNSSLGWSEDSRTVFVSIAGVVGGSEVVAYPLDGAVPYQVYATAMKIGHLSVGGGMLALQTDISRSGLARASTIPTSQPDLIDPANGFTWSPSFAPDGTLAFLSNRTGTNAIWLMKKGVPPTMLFDGGFSQLFELRFSPDGTKLALATETPETVTVKIMTRGGASISSFNLPSLGLGLPSWTPDSKAVIVFDRRTKRTFRVPIDNPAQRSPFAAPHWVGISILEEGTFATRADTRGIWRIDQGTRQINGTYPKYYQPPLAFRGNDVLVPEYGTDSVPHILAQPLSEGPAQVIAYAPGAENQPSLQTAFAVNPVTGEIIYVSSVMKDTNIDLLTLARR
jgi:Tol biopolymer transport system component/DNA-binding winged helix-turn-helix (wHTH) protein